MKKKYALQCVNFQIKTYYHKAFTLLKSNYALSLYDNTQYKRMLFKHLIKVSLEEREKTLEKAKLFLFFNRVIKLKYMFKDIRLILAQNKKQRKLRCNFLSYQLTCYFKQFVKNGAINSGRNHLLTQYNIFFVKRIYINFFKSVCKYISSNSKRLKKYQDANELYLFKLEIKILRKLRENVSISQQSKARTLRKRILMRIYYKNLKGIVLEYNRRCFYYRCLHVKKYYFHLLSRIIKAIGNNRIAKLKFMSKWLIKWKEVILINKRARAEGVVLLNRVLDKIRIKQIVKGLRKFFYKFKEKNRSILKYQINEIKYSQFVSSHMIKFKMAIFMELRYNMIISKYTQKRNFLMKKNVFQVMKFIKDTSIPMYLKEEEASNHYKLRIYKRIIKPFIVKLRKESGLKRAKIKLFRVTMLKIKIIKLLKVFKIKSKKENSRRESRFRRYFLMYKFMNMLKKHSLIIYRENKIISGIKRIITKNRLKYIKWGFRSARNNCLVNLNKRRRYFKLLVQVITAMKMLSMQNGYYMEHEHGNEYDHGNEHENEYENEHYYEYEQEDDNSNDDYY